MLPVKFDIRAAQLTNDQRSSMMTAVIDQRVSAAMHAFKTAEHPDPKPVVAAITQALAERGFAGVSVSVTATEVVVTVPSATAAQGPSL